MGKKKKASTSRISHNQRALIVGVSNYPNPDDCLPGVASDVKAMAKLLSSKNGNFDSAGVTTLTDKQATQSSILSALENNFKTASTAETLFVYFAGHGDVEGSDYYFVAHDTTDELNETGVSLKTIKTEIALR